MAATIIDSRIFGDIFSSAAMRQVWSDENRTAKYIDIERALAIVQGGLGIIPQEAADEIVRNCDISKIDFDKLKAQTERIGYPIIAVVNQINALLSRQARASTATGARRRRTSPTPRPCCRFARRWRSSKMSSTAISAALAKLAREHRDTPMAGRSNLQQAIPITFGYKMATHPGRRRAAPRAPAAT